MNILRSTSFLTCALLGGLTLAGCDRTIDSFDSPDSLDTAGDPKQEEPQTPTGTACSMAGQEVTCGDDEEVLAYCSYIESEQALQFGPCLAPEQRECEPGDWKHVEGPPPPEDEDEEDWGDPCSGTDYLCEVEGGVPYWAEQYCDTPLVLSFDAAPVQMIAAESTPMATFDISMRDDSCISTDWPSAVTPWLVVDLDGNGSIDGGHELFGSGTSLADGSHAQNGFAALAEFDADGDDDVDSADPRFAELMLWRDWDADRVSTPDELTPLLDSGVHSLPVEFQISVACDERGNCGVQRAAFEHSAGVGELVDVYLSCH
ncbi:hemolysin-type calcium binding protein [Enhygromyxa salina]|uniref:Hemolysin-type calcium binding protein n=1 Tax=Enhygromyxa salina TaxID=215803 RepID=A0A0C1ZVB3_9BACT|nr:hypothetical protein [Enhygromyxa salina]KIG15003.1 hemolysin-type calcium binding protein [Enhygromyxa salina]